MAKTFKCPTRSAPGNAILGVLFLICAFGLLATPCLGLVGTVFGCVTLPTTAHDALGTLFVAGVAMLMALGTLILGVLCLNATLLPKTLHIGEDRLEFFWFSKQLGQVPYANVKEVIVKTRAMAGQTANSAFWQGFLAGGLIAGLIASRRFNPHEPIGIIIKLVKAHDPDTFWPQGWFRKADTKQIEALYIWKLPHPRLVDKISKALDRYSERNTGRDNTNAVCKRRIDRTTYE
jgi:hypothetical protein